MAETNWDELRFGMPLNVWLMIDGRAQKHIRDLYERVDVGHAIIAQQEVELARLRGALEPFARAAEDCGVIRDIEAGAVKPEQNIWESATSLSINYEHVANAYSVLDSRKAERADANTNPASSDLSSLRKGAEDQLRAALQLAKDMFIANNLSLPHTFEVIDAALVSGSREEPRP